MANYVLQCPRSASRRRPRDSGSRGFLFHLPLLFKMFDSTIKSCIEMSTRQKKDITSGSS